ncbi:MAG: PKD domain-containing protein [Anaerolineae bacterium]
MQDLIQYLKENKLIVIVVVTVWALVVIAAVLVAVLVVSRIGLARPPEVLTGVPTITVEPTSGPPGTSVTVRGENWTPETMVLIYLLAPGETALPSYAMAGNLTDAQGRFDTQFTIPSEAKWRTPGVATVVAQVIGGGLTAQTPFNLEPAVETPTPTVAATPTLTPTATVTITTPMPITPVQPDTPRITANTDLNVRSGPGTNYPSLGLLAAGQTAPVTGRNAEGSWWQIAFPGVPGERGWVAGQYVTAENVSNVPVVAPPPPPQQPTPPLPLPTVVPPPPPTPSIITDWRGEYFNNPALSGSPVLVRNDPAINFDWGAGSPAPNVSPDRFSVRWTRTIGFPTGTYRFYVRVDDGVRLWIDGNLVIDQWRESAPALYAADVTLSEGPHHLRVEYFEWTGNALIQLMWERLESYPDWKAEYYANPNLEGSPVLVRNEVDVNYNWGQGSPGPGVPADNFSARWTRQIGFESGTYRFSVRVDDGARLWIDDQLLIDDWRDGGSRLLRAERSLGSGIHRLRLEYYERTGDALITLRWERVDTGQGQPANRPPKANPGGPYVVDEGSEVILDGTASRDEDGHIVLYQWGTTTDGRTINVIGSGPLLSTSFPDGPTSMLLGLRVTDNRGATDLAITRVDVRNVPPIAFAGGPYSGRVGQPVTLSATAYDPSPIDQATLSYRWDFGDGLQGSGAVVSHIYNSPGTYIATVTVTDKDGGQGYAQTTVHIGAMGQPPQAIISGPTSAQVGQLLTFSAVNSYDPDGQITRYRWDFGDGNTAEGIVVNHVYNNPAIYQVTLLVIDSEGMVATAAIRVDIMPPTPTPTPTPTSTPTSTPGPTFTPTWTPTATWTPEPTPTGTLVPSDTPTPTWTPVPTDTPTATGTPEPTPTGTLTPSATPTPTWTSVPTDTPTATWTPEPTPGQPPVAQISGPASGLVGEGLIFDGSSSYDPDGAITTYTWDFGDGTGASDPVVQHAYAQAGVYSVVLTVVDDGGLAGQAFWQVTIEQPTPVPTDTPTPEPTATPVPPTDTPTPEPTATPTPGQPPVAQIAGPTSGLVGEELVFDGTGSSDPDGDIETYAWDFGDGTTANKAKVKKEYAQPGTYIVLLTVTDNGGLSGQASWEVVIEQPTPTPVPNQPPVALIVAPPQAQVGMLLVLDGSGSVDPDGSIIRYAWNFGDGSAWNGITVNKVYTQTGVYTITLTVTDNMGATGQAVQPITIEPPPPDNVPPTAVISGAGMAGGLPQQPLAFSGVTSSDSDGTIVQYIWDFGDGTVAYDAEVIKVYEQPGTYTVVLTVTDDKGLSGQAWHAVTIVPAPE